MTHEMWLCVAVWSPFNWPCIREGCKAAWPKRPRHGNRIMKELAEPLLKPSHNKIASPKPVIDVSMFSDCSL